MQEVPLGIGRILRHGQSNYLDSRVITFQGERTQRTGFAEVGERAERLARVLSRLGVGKGDRVGTFCWNHQEHLEAYLAVPSMGAVLHTLNIRLFPDQLAYVINDAEDRVIIADASLAPLLARVGAELKSVEKIVSVGQGDTGVLSEFFGEPVAYDEALSAEDPGFAWPEVDERDAAAMCYTSGTTGNPKGVVYSHRSTTLHSMAITSSACLGLSEADRELVIVPMFHANAWGLPYGAWLVGTDMIMPQRFLQAEHLSRMIGEERPTLAAGVPTIWNDLLHYSRDHEVDLSSLRAVTAGGSAVPRSLMEQFQERFGVPMIQGWGMTETSPLCALGLPPKSASPGEEMEYRARTGRVVPGVELRVVAEDGSVLPNDGKTVGEFEVRGPWVTGSYYGDPSPDRFHEGWLRTGDVGWLDSRGYMQISDRTKDVIKTGGEWISSVELENAIMAHPDVVEAAVVGVPDPRWDERPLACVVLRSGAGIDGRVLSEFLGARVAKWWIPERWAFVEEIPKTSVGKFDKKALRSLSSEGRLAVGMTEG